MKTKRRKMSREWDKIHRERFQQKAEIEVVLPSQGNLFPETKTTARLFKVLVPIMRWDQKTVLSGSVSNSSFDWTPYLPSKNRAGKRAMIKHDRPLVMCSYGLHVTSRPVNWGMYSNGARVFEVKVFGPILRDPGGNKVCVYQVQLVREIPRYQSEKSAKKGKRS